LQKHLLPLFALTFTNISAQHFKNVVDRDLKADAFFLALPFFKEIDYDTPRGFKNMETVVWYMKSTLTTLVQTHKNGFVNGDLKDSNIIVQEQKILASDISGGEDNRIVPHFTDWGASVKIDVAQKTNAHSGWKGTIEYVSPEGGLAKLKYKETPVHGR